MIVLGVVSPEPLPSLNKTPWCWNVMKAAMKTCRLWICCCFRSADLENVEQSSEGEICFFFLSENTQTSGCCLRLHIVIRATPVTADYDGFFKLPVAVADGPALSLLAIVKKKSSRILMKYSSQIFITNRGLNSFFSLHPVRAQMRTGGVLKLAYWIFTSSHIQVTY